ncbi:MAG: hypothetical protein Q4B14_01985 [Clostridia bacterium]|nr:hypothetical protein [Clostridia bacterium]
MKHNENLSFSNKMKVLKLKNMLKEEQSNLSKISKAYDDLLAEFEDLSNEYQDYRKETELSQQESDKELKEIKEQHLELRKKWDMSENSKEQLDAIHKNLHRIHTQAENDAADLIDEAKSKVMEVFFVVNKINDQLETLKADIKHLENDLEIGTKTVIDRIGAFYQDIDNCTDKLNDMKRTFYKENNVPLD